MIFIYVYLSCYKSEFATKTDVDEIIGRLEMMQHRWNDFSDRMLEMMQHRWNDFSHRLSKMQDSVSQMYWKQR